ncbi:MAG: hypothetical protein U0414_28295 [Polyangiaceae bacterium]
MRRSALAAAALACASCTAGKAFYAGANDFGAYRETRVAPTEEARLAASGRYLRERPDGAYAEEVKADFAERERAYFAACGADVAKLTRYLELFPDGPHAADAKRALAVDAKRAAEPDALDAAAAATRERLEALSAGRARARDALVTWVEASIDPSAFAAPLGDGALVVPFALSLPEPRCELHDPDDSGAVRRCVKLLESDFSFPRAGSFVEHALLFDVSIEMSPAGTPIEIRIAGPELFTRFEETFIENREGPDDMERRINAIERVIDVVSNVFDANVSSDPGCAKRDLAPSEVARLSCEGLTVRVTAGREPGDDDVIHIRHHADPVLR